VTIAEIIAAGKNFISTGALVALMLYLANLYRTRVRVRVRILAEQFYNPDKPPSVEFEVENVGLTATSIEPIVPFNRNFRSALLNMQLLARTTAPDRSTLRRVAAAQAFHRA
jgi:hypothetical protein